MATVRVLAAADAEAMATLRRQGYETDPLAFAGKPDTDPTCSSEAMRVKLATQTADASSVVLGAFAPELVGLLGVAREEPGKFLHKARLWGFYVEPESRRNGIGRRLLDEAAVQARRMGVEQLTLRVCSACDAAIAIYRPVGFESFGLEPRALKVGAEYFGELHMMALLER
jgi:ribosomal protein S18 acetylase RimI-like enzyme